MSLPPRVLLVDDDQDVRLMTRVNLTFEGFQVDEAADGHAAVDRATTEPPDAVVLDLMMPGMGGMAAIPEIKQLSPETKVVVFSALSEDQAGPEALARGADAYIEKTQVMSRLPDTISRLCHC